MTETPGPDAPPEPPEPTPPKIQDRLREIFDPVITFHYEHPVYFWLVTVAIVASGFAVGAIVAPELVIDRFLWTHFWGPTAADANQAGVATRNGIAVTEDYTLTSEIIYGLILAGALVSIYTHLFKKRGIAVDAKFIAALLPYVFFGPLARSLEDASVFCEMGTEAIGRCDPGLFSWLFISPFIYMVAAAAVITHLLLAHATTSSARKTQYRTVAGWLTVQVLAYLAVYLAFRGEFVAVVTPSLFAGLAVVAMAVYMIGTERGGKHLHWALAAWGLPMTLVPVALITQWEIGTAWVEPNRAGAWEAIPVTFGLTLLVVGALALLGWFLKDDAPDFASFVTPLNLGLVAGHMIDGFATFTALCSSATGTLCQGATFLGVETGGYGEKHPVSELFLGFADGWGFPAMKLLLVVLIIVLIDRSAREGDEDPDLIGLVKLAVLVLGLGPGLRNVVRVSMGV